MFGLAESRLSPLARVSPTALFTDFAGDIPRDHAK
jgi:hypothetical protein